MKQFLNLLRPLLRPFLRPHYLYTPLSSAEGYGGASFAREGGVGGEASFLLFLLLTSCQKDLCYTHPHGSDVDHGRLHVAFDWSETQNPTASSMRLVAFAGGRNAVGYPLAGMSGGDVSLWGGQYWFVAYNSDTETTQTRGSDYADFEVCGVERDLSRYLTNFHNRAESFTRFGARSQEGSRSIIYTRGGANAPAATDSIEGSDLRFIWEPERVWVSTAQAFTVEPATEQTLAMKMWAATYQYTFHIRNVANLDRVSSISATLSGLASGYSPARRSPTDYTVAEIFAFHKADSTSIRGSLRVFGHSPDEEQSEDSGSLPIGQVRLDNLLTLYVTMDNGTQYGFEFEVTEDMQHPEATSIDLQTGEIVIDIQIDDIPIPDQPSTTSPFDVDIDDFETEEWDVFPKTAN